MDKESNQSTGTNKQSVESVFLGHEKLIRAVAFTCTPAPDMIDDIVQEVFLELRTKQDRWTLTDSVETRHLLAILTQQVTKRLWHQLRRNMPDNLARIADRLYQKPGTVEHVIADDRSERLLLAIDRLKQTDQLILHRYYFEQATTGEIALELGITEDHVRRQLSRAREKLRIILENTNENKNSVKQYP